MYERLMAFACVWIAAYASTALAEVPVESETASHTELSASYIGLQAFVVRQDSDRQLFDDDGSGFRAIYGHRFSGNWFWEIQLAEDTLETGIDGFTDFYQLHLGGDLVYRFGESAGFQPFVLLGVGAVRDDVFPDRRDNTSAFGNAGIGFVSGMIGKTGLRFRAEARYVSSDFDRGFNDWHLGLGLEAPLGQTRVVERTITRTKTVVTEVEVAPLDSDGDGVRDMDDRCHNTLAGAKVNEYGCVVPNQIVRLSQVNFELNSNELTRDSRNELAEVVKFLANQPGIVIEVAGHTDSVGDKTYNQRLSLKRADAVRRFLVQAGVEPRRLRTRGYGEADPIASNATREGRALNRRVEFRIQE